MLSILCPHCQTQLAVEPQLRGRTIHCQSCGQQLAVAEAPPANATAEALSVVISPRSASASRRRKPAIGNRVISTMLHLSIPAATIYAGYYLLTQRRVKVPPQPVAVVEPAKKPEITPPKAIPKRRARPENELAPAPVQEKPLVIETVQPPVSPFEHSPEKAVLPASDDTSGATLMDHLTDTEIQFTSNATALQRQGNQLFWKDNESKESTAVAALAVVNSDLVFRWMASVPEEAENAIRNSIIRLESGQFQHVLTLRNAEITQPFQIDLNQAQQRIISKCEFLPPLEDVCFELTGIDELPPTFIDGADPARLRIRDQTTLQYSNTKGAATRLKMKRRGNLVAVELQSRYALPSGDEQAMTIEQGNNKLKALVSIHQAAQSADTALTDLRSRINNLQSEARAVSRSRATATAKSNRLGQLQHELLATQQQIKVAERLLGQKQAIEADHETIQKVAKLAQQLHETKLAYRFFTVVDGHEVDILIAQ